MPTEANHTPPEVAQAMRTLVAWLAENRNLLVQGRTIGIQIGLSPALKRIVELECKDPEVAAAINANTTDIKL